MRAERWETVKDIFGRAAELPSSERSAFISKECAGHPSLRTEVLSLLAALDEPDNVIEINGLDLASKLLPETPRLVGQRIGPWKLIREIGAGGMGSVFLGERADAEFEQRAAIKIIRHSIVDQETLRRFRDERQILARLQHPNIATLIDGGVSDDGRPYLAMEFVDGVSVTEACRDRTLNDRLRLFAKICQGLGYAHRNLVVHRDIKPSNILVDREGVPKLLDFGLAKLVNDADHSQTATAFRALTPAYASPEQLAGRAITTVSDIYSLGVVLFEVLTGGRPFETDGKDFDAILRTATAVEPELPSRSANNQHDRQLLRGDIDNIVACCLRKEPERRYSSAEALAADIGNYLEGRPVSARPSTFGYRLGKLYSRNRLAFVSAALLIAAVVAGLGISLWQAEKARTERDRAQAERAKAEQINRFLQQMLAFSDQSFTSISPVPQSKNVTVNEMLDQITPVIEAELADQPEVRAQILRTIGASYASQGAYDQADRNLTAALNTQRDLFGDDSVETANTMIDLGVLNYRRSKFDESRRLLEKAVNFYRGYYASHPDTSPAKLVQAMDFLADNRFYSGDSKGAVDLCEEALGIAAARGLQGREREALAGLKADYGYMVTRGGDNARGEELIHQAIALYNEISDKPRWEVGNAKTVLSVNLMNRGDLSGALEELADAERIIRASLGDSNLYVASALKGQANVLIQKGDLKAAENAAQSSLSIYRQLYPQNNAFSAGALVSLGTVLTRTNRAPDGEKYLREALSIYESQPSKNAALTVPTRLALIENLERQGKLPSARQLADGTIAIAIEQLGADNPITLQVKKWVDKLR